MLVAGSQLWEVTRKRAKFKQIQVIAFSIDCVFWRLDSHPLFLLLKETLLQVEISLIYVNASYKSSTSWFSEFLMALLYFL